MVALRCLSASLCFLSYFLCTSSSLFNFQGSTRPTLFWSACLLYHSLFILSTPFFPFLYFCPFLTKNLFYTKYYKRNLTKNYSQTLYIIFNLLCISHYTTKIDEDSGSNNFIFIVKRILPVVMYNNIVGIDFSEIR